MEDNIKNNRPYNYDENMKKLNIDNFSFYMRTVSCYLDITKEEINELKSKLE